MNLLLSEISAAVDGQLLGADREICGISIDTRSLVAGDLYVAIRGHAFDGHDFAANAAQAGAEALMVERILDCELPQIVVSDTRLALAEVAGYWRRGLPVKVAGVTGSNGKTTVKEMIAAIFATQGDTLATRGNLNNDIGVPLTLLRLNPQHRFAVIEMGANHPGEIAYTSRYAQADVSVITNVGPAHIEGFGSVQGVAEAKGEIFRSLGPQGVTVLNRDDPFYDFWLRNCVAGRRSVSFGFNREADVRAEGVSSGLGPNGFDTAFDLIWAGGTARIRLALAGKHNVKNALAAAAVALQFGIDIDDIKRGLEAMQPVTGRMQALLGKKGNTVIDDTYNANPASLQAALDAVDHCGKPVWLALGAFGELGSDSAALHAQMGKVIKAKSVQRLFATGELARHTVQAFGDGGQFFERQADLIEALVAEASGDEIILIKGSRAQKMENVVAALVDNFRADLH